MLCPYGRGTMASAVKKVTAFLALVTVEPWDILCEPENSTEIHTPAGVSFYFNKNCRMVWVGRDL